MAVSASPRLLVRTAAATALAVAALGTPAAATPPGVHVDPNSPAGKEYAIPLAAARDLGGGSGGSNGPAASRPLFGAGIMPRTRSGHSGTGTRSGRGSQEPASDSPEHEPAPRRSQPDEVPGPALSGGGPSPLAFELGAIGAVLLGALAVTVASRRRHA
jgi:hypothetical protein